MFIRAKLEEFFGHDGLADGEVDISDKGVRRNRYPVYFEEVGNATEQARESPHRQS